MELAENEVELVRIFAAGPEAGAEVGVGSAQHHPDGCDCISTFSSFHLLIYCSLIIRHHFHLTIPLLHWNSQ